MPYVILVTQVRRAGWETSIAEAARRGEGSRVRPGASVERETRGACKAFWKAVVGRTANAVDRYRALELERLDALQVALWGKAMAGDVKAALGVVRIIGQRCRLLGFDTRQGTSPGAGTVVAREGRKRRVGNRGRRSFSENSNG